MKMKISNKIMVCERASQHVDAVGWSTPVQLFRSFRMGSAAR
jgi:hypothetical protein